MMEKNGNEEWNEGIMVVVLFHGRVPSPEIKKTIKQKRPPLEQEHITRKSRKLGRLRKKEVA